MGMIGKLRTEDADLSLEAQGLRGFEPRHLHDGGIAMKVYTTKTGAKVLGVKQDTLQHYAIRLGIGSQPGGKGTPWLFTVDDLLTIRDRAKVGADSLGRLRRKWESVEEAEDREELGLGPLYNEDASPRS